MDDRTPLLVVAMSSNNNNKPQDYESVHVQSDDDDEGNSNEDSETRELRPRRRPPPPSTQQGGATNVIFFVWGILAVVVLAGFIVLMGYRRYTSNSKRVNPPTGGAVHSPRAGGVGGTSSSGSVIHYDASVIETSWDPFDLTSPSEHDHDSPLIPPSLPWLAGSEQASQQGFVQQPNIVNNTLLFVSEGDLYITDLSQERQTNTAAKLTTTVGNVRTPKLHPSHPHLIAYTATYQSRRDVYLLDLSTGSPAQRLTYWADSAYGVSGVVGWSDDTTLVVAAQSSAIGLPDTRLYQLSLATTPPTTSSSQVLQVKPIPIAQALEAAFDDDYSETDGCLYFTRFRQGSHTARYVGGTAESLWAYCHGRELAVPLTADYIGTSKNPSILRLKQDQKKNQSFLLFLSDRSSNEKGGWTPTTMNLWAIPLPSEADLYSHDDPVLETPIQLTAVSCQFNGQALQEYSVDPVTGQIVLRIGADLHRLTLPQIQPRLLRAKPPAIVQPAALQLKVLSDFHEQQERLVKVDLTKHLSTTADILDLQFGTTVTLLTLRGQLWVAPVVDQVDSTPYQGAGQNLPARRYRVLPGAMTGGSMRVLAAVHVPLSSNQDEDDLALKKKRIAVVLATDPTSPTAEHAFYLVPIQPDSVNRFTDVNHMPEPFVGGHGKGGSTRDGGLGSVRADSVKVSPCGRRMAWADKDGRICVMTLPLFGNNATAYHVLPRENELGEPIDGDLSDFSWSPGGRYLAIEHGARNQFKIISIADCGDPFGGDDDSVRDIEIGRIVQATSSRFNSMEPYWGKSGMDIYLHNHLSGLSSTLGTPKPDDVATTLYFLTDRDIVTDVSSPWGTRAPSPHFPRTTLLYALPLSPTAVDGDEEGTILGRFPGGGALEIFSDQVEALEKQLKEFVETEKRSGVTTRDDDDRRKLRASSLKIAQALKERRVTQQQVHSIQRYLRRAKDEADEASPSQFPKDMNIEFGAEDIAFARTAYRIVHIPEAEYLSIVSQTIDDGSFVLVQHDATAFTLSFFSAGAFPSDQVEITRVVSKPLAHYGISTSREYVYFLFATDPSLRVVSNKMTSLSAFMSDIAGKFSNNVVDTANMAISVWPKLEYQQMFNDAWRMLRDYFYDKEMHGVDWTAVYDRYKDLVARCSKREELDDVMAQMASELSALHVFVYGGEYNAPFNGDAATMALYSPASLGASLLRSPEWKGYLVTEIADRDPDFNLLDGAAVYSPLSDRTLYPTGQRGLAKGDVIVGINGESVMSVPDIHMLLRGMADTAVRLEVLRLASGARDRKETTVIAEPLVTGKLAVYICYFFIPLLIVLVAAQS